MTEKIQSIAVILDYLEIHNTATSSDLINRLEEKELKSSPRTFERLKETMKDSFGLELVYENKAYRLKENPNPAQDWLYKMIETIREMDFYRQALENPKFQNRILHEEVVKPDFYRNLTPIFEAIVKSRKIQFIYHFFSSDEHYTIDIEPYLLKRYQQRWYVIGYSEYSKGLRNYGLDRISGLKVLNKKFTFSDYESIIENYNSIVGLNYSEDPIRLVLRAYNEQRLYLKEVPLHHSQKELSSQENWTDYEYHLRPNFELSQQLLRIADQSKVIEPEFLKKQLIDKLNNGLKKYQ